GRGLWPSRAAPVMDRCAQIFRRARRCARGASGATAGRRSPRPPAWRALRSRGPRAAPRAAVSARSAYARESAGRAPAARRRRPVAWRAARESARPSARREPRAGRLGRCRRAPARARRARAGPHRPAAEHRRWSRAQGVSCLGCLGGDLGPRLTQLPEQLADLLDLGRVLSEAGAVEVGKAEAIDRVQALGYLTLLEIQGPIEVGDDHLGTAKRVVCPLDLPVAHRHRTLAQEAPRAVVE